MASAYTIQAGDTLVRIAAKFGLDSWKTIYNAPENAAFRTKRPNPDKIFPGDVVMIPGRSGPVKLCNRAEPKPNPGAATSFFQRVK